MSRSESSDDNVLAEAASSPQQVRRVNKSWKSYGLEVCVLNKSQIASLDFVINRFFMKMFKTNNINIVKACQEYFSFDLPGVVLLKRVKKISV